MTQATASSIDTIAAQATPPGRGGVGIIRISGPESARVAETLLGTLPKPRFAHYGPFYGEDGAVMDEGIALWFPDLTPSPGKMFWNFRATAAPSLWI